MEIKLDLEIDEVQTLASRLEVENDGNKRFLEEIRLHHCSAEYDTKYLEKKIVLLDKVVKQLNEIWNKYYLGENHGN